MESRTTLRAALPRIRTPEHCKGREKDLNDLETGITVITPVVQTSAANRVPRREEITIGERS
jgi:hypothetical protein